MGQTKAQMDVVVRVIAKMIGFNEVTKKVAAAIKGISTSSKTTDKKRMDDIVKVNKALAVQRSKIKKISDDARKQGALQPGGAQELIDKVSYDSRVKGRLQEEKRVDTLQKDGNELNNIFTRFNSTLGALRMPQAEFKKFTQEQMKFTSGGARFIHTIRRMAHGLRGFRMEALGVMFAGQNLNKSMMNFLQPAIQARNLTEEWGQTMRKLFLPVIKAIEPIFDKFTDWLENLSPAAKMVIGSFVVFLAVLGKLMFLFGAFTLAMGSLLMIFPKARNGAYETATAIAAIGTASAVSAGSVGSLAASLALLGPFSGVMLGGGVTKVEE